LDFETTKSVKDNMVRNASRTDLSSGLSRPCVCRWRMTNSFDRLVVTQDQVRELAVQQGLVRSASQSRTPYKSSVT
jgi:hypothetical protein